MPKDKTPKVFELALVKETKAQLPVSMRSHFNVDQNLNLAPLHMPEMNVIKARAKDLFVMYGTTPGLVNRPLTDDEKAQLTPFEIATYNLWLQATDEECPFEITRYLNDMIIGPPTQKSESTVVKGDVKDWREVLRDQAEQIQSNIQEARRKEAEIEQAVDAEITDINETSP